MQKEYPYTTDLRLTHSKDDADGNMLFGVANSKEMHAYMAVSYTHLTLPTKRIV